MDGNAKGKVAKFDILHVRKEDGTRSLANELARLLSARHGHRVTRPDAVHAAIKHMVWAERKVSEAGNGGGA